MSCELEIQTSKEKVETAKKICLSIQSNDRICRKNAYIDLQKFLSSYNEDFSQQDLRNIFNETHMYILNGLSDKTESVREQAIKFISFLIIKVLPLNDYYLTYIFPVIVERIGSDELNEDSEEIRLEMLQLVNGIILKYSGTEQLKPFLGDSVVILSHCVKDKYPAIKELSCSSIICLAEALPRDFHFQAETLIKPVLTCFTHQRYKVRVQAIKTIGEIILHSTYKGLEDVLGPLAEKLFDQIAIVRKTVAQVAGKWLLVYRDRYSFFAKIMPLLLTGLNDEVMETRIEVQELWQKVGLQYQEENIKDFKDQLDYSTFPKYYPDKFVRPNIGCRALVQRNIGKIIPALSKELVCWQPDIRFQCSQLLCSIVLLAEGGVIMHLQELMPSMYISVRDDENRVVDNIVQASEILGTFVSPETWLKLVLPVLEDEAHYGHLLILSGLINGTPNEYIQKHLETITTLLAEDTMCYSRQKKYQLALLQCVKVLSAKLDNELSSEVISYHLFKILVALLALRNIENQVSITSSLFDELAMSLHLKSVNSLWDKHTSRILKHINIDPKTWTKVTDHYCIFVTIVSESKDAFGKNLDIIIDILSKTMSQEADLEQKLNTLFILSQKFSEKNIFLHDENTLKFFEKVILEIIVSCLIWHAGAKAEAIRTMAATCLKYILQFILDVNFLTSSEKLTNILDKLQPLLLSLTEDASFRSRQLGMECLLLLKQIACKHQIWTIKDLLNIYPEVLKRFDDPTEKVRLCSLHMFNAILTNTPEEFKNENYKSHHQLILETLFTHFDDDEDQVQLLVFDGLKIMTTINYDELKKKLNQYRKLLRNQDISEKLLQQLEQISI